MVDGKMNSLNIISAKVSPPASPAPSRSNSLTSIGLAATTEDEGSRKDGSGTSAKENETFATEPNGFQSEHEQGHDFGTTVDENAPLLLHGESKDMGTRTSTWHLIPRRMAASVWNSIRWVLSALASPGVYLIACLYDENENFAPFRQLRILFRVYRGNTRKLAADYHEAASMSEKADQSLPGSQDGNGRAGTASARPAVGTGSSSSGLSSESESDLDRTDETSNHIANSRHGRSKSLQDSEEIAPSRRSIRIRLQNDDSLRQRKHRKAQSAGERGGSAATDPKDISAQLKSPTSPAGALTKYPKMPAPPRPLLPRRQPSYINLEPTDRTPQKTLILDLDETLIHSMSKGGRMSTGHMVEVRLNTAYVSVGGQANIGPQHPILYYVHKRPHCDDFLRRVRDMTDRELGRHGANVGEGMQVVQPCYLHGFGAGIRRPSHRLVGVREEVLLGQIVSPALYLQAWSLHQGPQLSRAGPEQGDDSGQQPAQLYVPPRQVFLTQHRGSGYGAWRVIDTGTADNAIPIQGWINDPTDNDLLHLVPFLEGLQYVSDVRALLALRGGEDGQHMA